MASSVTPLSPVDAAWFHMDRPANEVLVTGVAITRTPLDFARVRDVWGKRLLAFRRFRQRIVEAGFPLPSPHWQDDPNFDVDAHIHHIALPEPGDEQTLLDLLGDLASTHLDHGRPLWQVHVVDRVGGGSALVLRFHHCMGDGTAMIALSDRLMDATEDGWNEELPAVQLPRRSGPFELAISAVRSLADEPAQAVGKVQEEVGRLLNPDEVLKRLGMVAAGVGSAGLALLRSPDPPTPLKGRLSGTQRVALSAPVPLDVVKAIGAATGTKVNDVLVAAMAGALRHYMLERGARRSQMHIRAVVPVDLRTPERALELGNAFGLTFLDLPVDAAEPLARLRATKRGMDAIKRSPEAVVFLNLLALFGQTPKAVEDVAASVFGSKSTLVMTNVAGPKSPLYLVGSEVERMVFWVPHPVTLGVGVSILSYNGQVTLGVITDASVVPDPQRIADRFSEEFALMRDGAAAAAQPAPVAPAEAVEEPPAEELQLGAVAPQPADRCEGMTRAGERCRRRPVAGTRYCRAHQA